MSQAWLMERASSEARAPPREATIARADAEHAAYRQQQKVAKLELDNAKQMRREDLVSASELAKRQADFDRFAGFYDLEVDVTHFAANRVHLEVAHNHVVLFAVQRQFDDGGVELFFLQGKEYGFVVNGNSSGIRAGAVNYGRHTAFAAQAAARTSTLLFAHLGFNFERHGKTPF